MSRKRRPDNELAVSAGAAAAPARHSAASRPRAKRATPAAETAALGSEPPVAIPVEGTPLPVQEPTREEIAALAYLYWEARGCQGGSPEEDWLRAEQELRLRSAAATVA